MSTVSKQHRCVAAAAVLNKNVLLECLSTSVFLFVVSSRHIFGDAILVNARFNGILCVKVHISTIIATYFRHIQRFQEMLGRYRIFHPFSNFGSTFSIPAFSVDPPRCLG